MTDHKEKLIKIYNALRKRQGFLNWWPARGAFEVMLGAILTQNTAWGNAEKALSNLKRENLIHINRIQSVKRSKLARLIRPSGYYNQKTDRLKILTQFIRDDFRGSISEMKRSPARDMRKKLLSLNGIGPETADSILLYALNKKIFVVDAYTRRMFSRIGLIPFDFDYQEMQEFFTDNIPDRLSLFKDYHAQIVIHCKEICKKRPLCDICPIENFCGKIET